MTAVSPAAPEGSSDRDRGPAGRHEQREVMHRARLLLGEKPQRVYYRATRMVNDRYVSINEPEASRDRVRDGCVRLREERGGRPRGGAPRVGVHGGGRVSSCVLRHSALTGGAQDAR